MPLTPNGRDLIDELATAVRSQGISAVSKRTGLDRSALSRAINRRSMSFVTVAMLAHACGLTLRLSDEGCPL